MNIFIPLLLVFTQAAATSLPPPVALPMPPADWTALPELAFERRWPSTAELSYFVRDEVRAGRCAITAREIRVDLAVMVAASGQVRRIIPRAIHCPTVEQYASGLVSRMARGNVAAPGSDTWYRTAMTFSWGP